MNEQTESLLTAMADAGCGAEEIERAGRLQQADDLTDLITFLKQCRCNLLDQMHESQKRVDLMDYLIRQTEKRNMR